MTKPRDPALARPPLSRPPLSRRRLLGGALTAALVALLPTRDSPVKPPPSRWRGKTRWIGHA